MIFETNFEMNFETSDPNVLNEWLTLGPAARLAGTSSAASRCTRLLGSPVQVWREATGEVHARAHGRALAAQVRYGYVWVCAGEGVCEVPAKPLFAFPQYSEAGRRIVDCDGIGVATSALRVIENFLDMGHFPFVHPGILGEVPKTEVLPYQVRVDTEADEIWATECRFHQPRASSAASGAVLAQYQYRVMQPMSAMLYKTCTPRPEALDAIGLFVQPLNEENVIAYALLVYFDDQTSDTDMIAFQQTIFAQDKPVLENQRPKRLPLAPGTETPVRCDATSAAYRRWLRAKGMRYGAIQQ
jgi:phenylpropionate dioxygenase-like ring-hydroxylating dioxygenase large terminal subunit